MLMLVILRPKFLAIYRGNAGPVREQHDLYVYVNSNGRIGWREINVQMKGEKRVGPLTFLYLMNNLASAL